MASIMATTAEVQQQIGSSAIASGTDPNTATFIDAFLLQAESMINVATKHNWSDDFDALNDDVKGILRETAIASAASKVILFDIGRYGITLAQTMFDFHNNTILRNLSILRTKLSEEFIRDPADTS